MGIRVPDREPTPSPVPETRPIGIVDTSQRLQHTISFVDETTPKSKAKPYGVYGCEIWFKIGDTPPADPSELNFAALDTASPYMLVFSGSDVGKTTHYMLRWVNTRGQAGPWSETVSAVIT